jgi:hypothetical protein
VIGHGSTNDTNEHADAEGPEARRCRNEMAATALRTAHHAFDSAVGGVPDDIEVAIMTVAGRADLALPAYRPAAATCSYSAGASGRGG